MEGYQLGGGMGEMGKKVQGIRSINGRYKIGRGEIKNSMGNGEAKELICMTQGHDLMGRNCWRESWYQAEGYKGRKTGTAVMP